MSNRQREVVVLVHGLAGSRLDMVLLSHRLKRAGFRVENWGYWSLNTGIQRHADRLAEKVQSLQSCDSVDNIHLVGHSMGGIIIRSMLANNFDATPVSKLSRVIMLASPNRGSFVATKLTPWLGWLAPSLGQLSDEQTSFVNRLPNSLKDHGIEFGTVEASKDRVIRPDCIQLDGQTDFARVEGHHGVLTWYAKTGELVERFLCSGKFLADSTACQNSASDSCQDHALQV